MKLDKALQYKWAGRDIKRRGWALTLKETLYGSNKEGMVTMRETDIDADDWEVVNEEVGWVEAIDALLEGKIVIADLYGDRKPVRMINRVLFYKTSIGDLKQKDFRWHEYGDKIPITWIRREDFEIVED